MLLIFRDMQKNKPAELFSRLDGKWFIQHEVPQERLHFRTGHRIVKELDSGAQHGHSATQAPSAIRRHRPWPAGIKNLAPRVTSKPWSKRVGENNHGSVRVELFCRRITDLFPFPHLGMCFRLVI